MPKLVDLAMSPSPGEAVSIEELQSYINRYKTERHKHILKHVTDDSRSIWISKLKLMEFFNSNPDADGARLYFGVIEDDNAGFKQGTHNLIFVPTEKSGTSNYDQLTDNDWVIVVRNPAASSMVGDPQGAICPPPRNPCGGNTLQY